MRSVYELSIIVVNWNVRDLLESCLHSIQQHTDLDPSRYEVRIIDNNSSDGSTEMVRKKFPDFHLTENQTNKGFGRANNQAFSDCQGKYILLLNPDTEVQENAIGEMLRLMKTTPEAGILGARLINSDGSFQRSSGGALPTLYNVAWHYLLLNQILPKQWAPLPTFLIDDIPGTFDIGWVSGAALMLRREVVDKEIFDNQFFMYGEDLELCDRVQLSGWRVLYTSEATIMHRLRQSLAKQTSAEMLASAINGNRTYFQIRHGRLKTWLYDLILTVGYQIRWPFFSLLSALKKNNDHTKKAVTNRRYAWVSFKSLLRGGR